MTYLTPSCVEGTGPLRLNVARWYIWFNNVAPPNPVARFEDHEMGLGHIELLEYDISKIMFSMAGNRS